MNKGSDADCPECGGCGWVIGSDMDCCGGSDWECGARGCTGPVQVQTQEQCEYCFGTGKDVRALTKVEDTE